jgi:hypothetical protein
MGISRNGGNIANGIFGCARTPWLAAATSPCPVLGWSEHSWSWEELKDSDLLRLLKIEASPDEVDVLRHFRGFVILKHERARPTS